MFLQILFREKAGGESGHALPPPPAVPQGLMARNRAPSIWPSCVFVLKEAQESALPLGCWVTFLSSLRISLSGAVGGSFLPWQALQSKVDGIISKEARKSVIPPGQILVEQIPSRRPHFLFSWFCLGLSLNAQPPKSATWIHKSSESQRGFHLSMPQPFYHR